MLSEIILQTFLEFIYRKMEHWAYFKWEFSTQINQDEFSDLIKDFSENEV